MQSLKTDRFLCAASKERKAFPFFFLTKSVQYDGPFHFKFKRKKKIVYAER